MFPKVMDAQQLRYPIGIEDFETIRKGGYLYVDKTDYLHQMLCGSKYFLLCRPRRFGKSLFLSTALAFFEGKRELFEGLAISQYDYDWEPSPVLHLNLVNADATTPQALQRSFDRQFKRWEEKYQMTDIADNLSDRFEEIIRTAYERTGKGVVILIDE